MIVQIEQALQDLRNINTHETLREFAKLSQHVLQGPVFYISNITQISKNVTVFCAQTASYSRMINRCSLVWFQPRYFTIFTWCSFFNKSISD